MRRGILVFCEIKNTPKNTFVHTFLYTNGVIESASAKLKFTEKTRAVSLAI